MIPGNVSNHKNIQSPFTPKPQNIHRHYDVIKWKRFQRYWPFVRGIHRSPVNSLHKSQWLGTLMVSLVCAWTNNWANNGNTGDFRRRRAYYDGNAVASSVSLCERSMHQILDKHRGLVSTYFIIHFKHHLTQLNNKYLTRISHYIDNHIQWLMLTSWYGNTSHITGPLCEESIGHRWIPCTKGQWCRALMMALLSDFVQITEASVKWDALAPMWRHCNYCFIRLVILQTVFITKWQCMR